MTKTEVTYTVTLTYDGDAPPPATLQGIGDYITEVGELSDTPLETAGYEYSIRLVTA